MQLSLQFHTSTRTNLLTEENFVLLIENSSAVNFLKKFFAQNNFATAQFPSLILKGPQYCGKTHLMQVLARKYHAEFIQKEKISEINPTNFFIPNHFYILEDFDEITEEEALLHLINSAVEAKAFLILTSKNYSHFQLRDLVSRLKNIFCVEIKNPSLDSVKQLLANGFSRKQINLSAKIINFIAENINRSYDAIFNAIKKVEFHNQESGKPPLIKDIKEMFKN